MAESAPDEKVSNDDILFAELLVSQGLAGKEQVEECLTLIRRLAESGVRTLPRLGELLLQKGYLAVPARDRTVVAPPLRAGTEESLHSTPLPILPAEVASKARDAQNLFGKYVLISKAGEGGFGAVYRAWQLDLGRFVALKFLHSEEPADVERFVREAQTAAKLSHRHIVPIYEVGEHDGKHFISMEFIRGQTLDKLRLDPRKAVEVMRDAALAVEYAHEHGIIHRDLKPQNLMMGEDGQVRVMDFGLARQLRSGTTLTVAGAVIGTPAFMPPEQAEGARCDERSDVYALGATLYALLTGHPPFEGAGPLEVLRKVAHLDPWPVRRWNPRVHQEVETIAAKAMEKNPAKRYRLAAEFAEDLRRHLSSEPILARPSGWTSRTLKWVRRHKLASAVGFVTSAAALVLAVGLALYTSNLDRARRMAEAAAEKARSEAARAAAAEQEAKTNEEAARRSALEAKEQRRTAEVRRAESLVHEGDALGIAGFWADAGSRYEEAKAAWQGLGRSDLSAELGLAQSYEHASPPLMRYEGHRGAVQAIAVLPDGRRALSASSDETLRLWDLMTGQETAVFRGHRGRISSIALHETGRYAVSGGFDGTVRVWDLATGWPIRIVKTDAAEVWSVAVSPNGSFALAGGSKGHVTLWDLSTGQLQARFPGHGNTVSAVGFSWDGLEVWAVSHDGPLILWDSRTGAQRARVSPTFARSAALSPNGRHVLTGDWNKNVALWDRQGKAIWTLPGHAGPLSSVAISPDGRRGISVGDDRQARLWDLEKGALVRLLAAPGTRVSAAAFCPDSRLVLLGGQDGRLLLMETDGRTEARNLRYPTGHRIQAVDISPDGHVFATGGDDGLGRVWDAATGRLLRMFGRQRGAVASVAFSPDGRKLATSGEDAPVRVWDISTGRLLAAAPGENQTTLAICWSPEGSLIASGGREAGVRVWDAQTGELRRRFPGHDQPVTTLSFLGDSRKLLSGSWDRTVREWDLESERPGKTLDTGTEAVESVAVSPDQRTLLIGTLSGEIRVVNLGTGRVSHKLKPHAYIVTAVRFSSDGSLAVTASADQVVKIWDTSTWQELRTFGGHALSVTDAAIAHGGLLASVDHDARIILRDLSRPARYRDFESRLRDAARALRDRPQEPGSLATLGEWFAFRGEWDWAMDLLRRARAGGAPVSPILLAQALWEAGDRRSAAVEFRQANELKGMPKDYAELCLRVLESETARTAARATPTASGVDPRRLRPGFYVEGFARPDLSEPVMRRVDRDIRFDWDKGPAWVGGPADGFSLRWSGWLRIAEAGTYTFQTVSDDGVRLTLGGAPLVSRWNEHPVAHDSVSCELPEGMYPLVLEYFEKDIFAILQLTIMQESRSGSRPLGPECLFHDPSPYDPTWKPQVSEEDSFLVSSPDSEGFVTCWLWLGPIPIGERARRPTEASQKEIFDRDHLPGLALLRPRSGDRGEVDGLALKWTPVVTEGFSVDLSKFATTLRAEPRDSIYLGVSYIKCDRDLPEAYLSIGADDSSLWRWNGTEVGRIYRAGGVGKDQRKLGPVTLKKGVNILGVAVINGDGGAGACARFVDKAGNPIRDFRIRFEPDPAEPSRK
jgi:WD40 repeat protein/predicted Ser/Thr protein kinase